MSSTRPGIWVTVFERADRIGGLLVYGIPNMKLDKRIVERRADLMTAEGVTFVTRTEVGKDLPASQLLTDFDAVVLCGGATRRATSASRAASWRASTSPWISCRRIRAACSTTRSGTWAGSRLDIRT